MVPALVGSASLKCSTPPDSSSVWLAFDQMVDGTWKETHKTKPTARGAISIRVCASSDETGEWRIHGGGEVTFDGRRSALPEAFSESYKGKCAA